MEITWFGYTCCSLTDDTTTLVSNPYDSSLGITLPPLAADIVTISHDSAEYNAHQAVQGPYKLVNGPGEYEIKNVFVSANAFYPAKATGDEARQKRNLVFVYEMDDITVCQPGALSKVPSQSQIEALDNVDVLLLPVGGGNVLNASQASELINLIQPYIVIPICYAIPNMTVELDPLEKFLKEMGQSQVTPLPKLRLSRSNLPEELQIVVLEPPSE